MDKDIHQYDLHDPRQYDDEKAYWDSKTPREKLHTLEVIRRAGDKLLHQNNKGSNGDQQRLRRVFRIIEHS